MRILCSPPEKCNRAIEVLYWIQVEKHENLHGQKIEKAKETWVPSTSKIEIPLQRQKNSHLSGFVFLECSHSDFTAQQLDVWDVWGSRSVSSVLQRVGTSVTLHADVNNCPPISHPSPISPTQTRCCRWLKQLKWLSSKIAYPLWGPADFSLPKLAACISSRSGSSTEGTEQSLEEQKD